MEKILLEFRLLSTLLVPEKVVYLIPLLLHCLVNDFLFSSIFP